MALIFNNLLINKNQPKYRPFLLNLLSGRRKILDDTEFETICSMMKKGELINYNDQEKLLYKAFEAEKQFITDNERAEIEKKMIDMGHFDIDNTVHGSLDFSVHLTWDCNMNCSYCIEGSYRNSKLFLNKKHIDAIYDFYCSFVDESTIADKTEGVTSFEAAPIRLYFA